MIRRGRCLTPPPKNNTHKWSTVNKFVTALTRACHWSLSWARWDHSTPSFYFSKIHFNITLPSTFWYSFRFSDHDFALISLLSHACYISHPSHPSWFYPNSTWRTVQSIKLFIAWFSPASCHFSLTPKHSTQHNVFTHLKSLNVRDQVPHQYKTTGKI
jgi:hypothetical protein